MVKRQATQPQKILILAAIPQGLRLDQQIREVEECIRRAIRRDMFEVDIRTAVRPQDIRRAIAEEKPTIVHFCGHGLKDGSLLLEDDGGQNKAVPPSGLASLFELHADYVKCVLLNACHSVKSAEEISKYINYTIGMNQEIQDKSAILFAQGFYDGLGYATPASQDGFQRAFQEGLVAIKLENLSQAQIPVIKIRINNEDSKAMEPVALTAAAIATLVLTKAIEKSGEKLGEAVLEQGGKLLSLLKRKSPNTATAIEKVAENPELATQQPLDYGEAVLVKKVEKAAGEDSEIETAVQAVVDAMKSQAQMTQVIENWQGINIKGGSPVINRPSFDFRKS